MRYLGFVGDGDTNTFSKLCSAKPYGDKTVNKLECVGHVQKRMGTCLRNLKKNIKGPLADGKTLVGKGRLTDKKIDKLQDYYGIAIRDNKNDLVSMREAIWAIYFHYHSTDAILQHSFCNIRWCKYKQAEREMELWILSHTNPVFLLL